MMTLNKMEDNLKKIKMEDDLKKKGRRPQKNGRRPNFFLKNQNDDLKKTGR